MNFQPHFNIKARELFRKIHRFQKINISASRHSLKEQLDLYLEHLSSHVSKKVPQKNTERILKIITRSNSVTHVINSKDYKYLFQSKQKLLGDVALGLVFCIDGRIPAIFLGGKFASHWEVPAAELTVNKRKSDGKLIPESNDLCEAFRKVASSDRDMLEIVFGHTSLVDPDHGCGAMAAKRKSGLLSSNLSNEEANLKIIEENSIPAITTIYNEFRQQYGLDELKRVCISAIYDTDSFGIIFGSDKNAQLSTTKLTEKYKDVMDNFFIQDNIVYASFRKTFTQLKSLTKFSQSELSITESLLTNPSFKALSKQLDEFIDIHYLDLTENQKMALKFFICRTMAIQYLIGACKVSKRNPFHPFSNHEEEYMAISTRGSTIGKYDPEEQGFCSTPSDAAVATTNIKIKLSIMSNKKKLQTQAALLFICNPVSRRDLRENNNQLHKVMDANAELFRAIIADTDLGKMVENLELLPISVLLDEDTSEILKIIDHSAYI